MSKYRVIQAEFKSEPALRQALGATILGSGEVALVLDVPRLIQSNHMHEAALRQA